MASNLDRFKADIAKLIDLGKDLEWAMRRDLSDNKSFDKIAIEKLGAEKAEVFLKKLPNFKEKYQSWYSESLVLIKSVLPDRIQNFISHYEKPKGRKSITVENYVIQDYLQDLQISMGGKILADGNAALYKFKQQLAILSAANQRFESSLFEIKQLVQADFFDKEIDAARELVKHKFFRAAGAIAGVVLERHLQQVCEDHTIKVVKKNPTISDLSELLRANSIIDTPQWRFISLLADIRNICDHNKEKDPTKEQVNGLLDGVDKLIKTLF